VNDRKYQMTRLRRGDYLLPSNDAQTLWRIYTYEEEGSLIEQSPDGGERAVTGMFWACARRRFPKPGEIIDLDGWSDDEWEFWAGPLPTRQAAIDEALRAPSPVEASA